MHAEATAGTASLWWRSISFALPGPQCWVKSSSPLKGCLELHFVPLHFVWKTQLFTWLAAPSCQILTLISPLSTAFYADPVYSSMLESKPLPHYLITLTLKYYVNLRFFRLYFCCLFKSKSALPTFVIHSISLYEGDWAPQVLEHTITSQVKWKLGE